MVPEASAELVASVAGGVVAAIKHRRERSLPDDWDGWLRALFPQYTTHPFGPHHGELWAWVWALTPGVAPDPFVAIWPRGGAKSTSAELGVVATAARQARRYCLYICSTQDLADGHVSNIAAMLESDRFSRAYPGVSERMIGKYGNSKGWRRNRLRTSSGFTVDAIGLDTASRGIKIEEARPDLIVLDDLDEVLDAPGTIDRKITTLTQSLLPTGTDDTAVLGVQNLIHADGIFARLADGRADFLASRIVSGPFPAIRDLTWETRQGRAVLTGGDPVWEGQDLGACQRLVDRNGLSAFLVESQHEVDRHERGTFAHVEFRHCEPSEVPDLVRIVLWVDPAVTDKDTSDAFGIQADGIASDKTIYRLFSWEARTSPEDALRRAILKAVELGSECVGIETDQGGDVWRPAYDKAWVDLVADPTMPDITGTTRKPILRSEKAGAGFGPKAHRAQQMLADYERGAIVHVHGTHGILERALRRFPVRKPFDLTDSAFWAWHDLVKRGAMDWDSAWGVIACPKCGRRYQNLRGDRPCPNPKCQ